MTAPNELEKIAVQARRAADIAKHVPFTDAEWDGIDTAVREAVHGQLPLANELMELGNHFAKTISPLIQLNKRLRAEAMYWKQAALTPPAQEKQQ
jgi:hypothetical protein